MAVRRARERAARVLAVATLVGSAGVVLMAAGSGTVSAIGLGAFAVAITVTISLISTQDITAMRPITSTWEFDYVESADGWHLSEVHAVEIGRQQGQGMESMFPMR